MNEYIKIYKYRPRRRYIRKIKNGRIKVLNTYWETDKPIKLEMEGVEFIFFAYINRVPGGYGVLNFLYLWGTKEYSDNLSNDSIYQKSIQLITLGGAFQYIWWYPVRRWHEI